LHDSQLDVLLDVLDSWLALEELQKDIRIDQIRSSDQEDSTESAVQATTHVTAQQKADQLQWIQARWGTDEKPVVSGGWTAPQSNKDQKNPQHPRFHRIVSLFFLFYPVCSFRRHRDLLLAQVVTNLQQRFKEPASEVVTESLCPEFRQSQLPG
jgi:hypothetical protein